MRRRGDSRNTGAKQARARAALTRRPLDCTPTPPPVVVMPVVAEELPTCAPDDSWCPEPAPTPAGSLAESLVSEGGAW